MNTLAASGARVAGTMVVGGAIFITVEREEGTDENEVEAPV